MLLSKNAEKKSRGELLSKTALLSMLGNWGRTGNYRRPMIATSHPDDIPWNAAISSKPAPHSKTTDTGYVFHDISWKQRVLSLRTFLPLNLIGRNQERLQVVRILQAVLLTTDPKRTMSIQVGAVYVQFPIREAQKLERKFQTLKYSDLSNVTSPHGARASASPPSQD